MQTIMIIWIAWNVVNALLFNFYRNIDIMDDKAYMGQWGSEIHALYFKERFIIAFLLAIIPLILSIVVYSMHKEKRHAITNYKANIWILLFGTSRQIMKKNHKKNYDSDILRELNYH